MTLDKYRQLFHGQEPFEMIMGGSLPYFELAYESWGKLSHKRDNVLLLFPGLSASAHAKSHHREDTPGWWEGTIGPGLGLDTNRFFIICFNHLGGCFGSTGPTSINPETGKPYGPQFPKLLLRDIANAVHQALTTLGITRLHAVIGASMGGMCALEYAASFPEHTQRLVMISASGRPGPQSIAYRYVQRQVVMNDPHFNDGWYYDQEQKPTNGMVVARQIGNITYRSRKEFNERFGRGRTGRGYQYGPDFQVESYLHHMGHKLGDTFDANSFMLLSKAVDLFSLGYGFDVYKDGVERITARSLIIGVDSDILFPYDEQESIYTLLKSANRHTTWRLLRSPAGHDAFLVEVAFFNSTLNTFMEDQPLEETVDE